MAKAYVFYNPLAANGACNEQMKLLDGMIEDEKVYCDMTEGYRDVLSGVEGDDYVVLCGGDGTLNRFINETDGMDLACDILYFACGSGNDFAHDLGHGKADKPYSIKKYLSDLPTVTVNGKTCRFLNGIGFGIDGYCCEEGDKIRAANPGAAVDYTAIAIKGLLLHYRPTNAKVTVDGVTREYKKVWLAPAMNGRFYGGGIMPTPAQDRLSEDKLISTMVFHGTGRLRTLMIFPTIFKGEHVKHTKHIEIFAGREITVEFDRPVALQIDGETVLGVTTYTAKQAVPAMVKA